MNRSICVLLSAYNGEKYISEQIDSVLSQANVDVQLLIRDDGSTDKTKYILKKYENDSRIKVIYGDNVGYKKSFINLLELAPKSEYYAFCDQDDIWSNEKLSVAITKIEQKNDIDNIPLLYTSALQCTDENLNPTRRQNFNNLKLNMYSEFVRHRFAGCTYVFNDFLRSIVVSTKCISEFTCPHDTLVSLVCWSCGGQIIYDSEPHIFFRRHGSNASVDGMGLIKRIKKEFSFMNESKDYKYYLANMLITYYDEYLTKDAKELYGKMVRYKTDIICKCKLLFDKRLDCGIALGNIVFRFGLLINRI